MRWSWRASLPQAILTGLLEGSLVGVVYLAVATFGSAGAAPLPLFMFWLAAGAGVTATRWRSTKVRRGVALLSLAAIAAALGWLWDPAARPTLGALTSPAEILALHPAGLLLGAAVLRGAVHTDAVHESEISTETLLYSFPLLAASIAATFWSGNSLPLAAVTGALVCVVAGLVSIGRARMREFDAMGPAARGGGLGKVVVATLAVVVAGGLGAAILIGTAAQGPIIEAGQSAAAAAWSALQSVGAWLQWLLTHIFTSSSPVGQPIPSATRQPGSGGGALRGPVGSGNMASLTQIMLAVVVVTLVIALVVAIWMLLKRRGLALEDAPPSTAREERHRDQPTARLFSMFPKPAIHLRMPFRHRPKTAVEAYTELLDELDELGEHGQLGRKPSETPLSHAGRAGALGLDPLPLSLLAADYQLAIYGNVTLSRLETNRAIGRWSRLRSKARHLETEERPAGGNSTEN